MQNSNGIRLKNSNTEISLDNTANKNDNKNFIEVGEGYPRNIIRNNVSSKNSLNSQNNVEVLDNMDVRK